MPLHILRPFLLCLPILAFTACKKKEEPKKSTRRLREEALQKMSAEHQAVKAFTDAMRGVLEWQQTQPLIQTAAERQAQTTALVRRMAAVPIQNLPPDLRKAWSDMLTVWQQFATQPQLSEAQRQQSSRTAEELNRQLAAVGIVDLHF